MDRLYYCNIDKDQELNKRISDRNVPSSVLQPQFSLRPISTKYSFLPIVDHRPPTTVPIVSKPVYSVEQVFNPGTTQSPWSGYASNINKETMLRNQGFAIQKNEQSVYVPSSGSDLYNSPSFNVTNEKQPFPRLFTAETFQTFNPNDFDLAKNTFNNFTRQQLLDHSLC